MTRIFIFFLFGIFLFGCNYKQKETTIDVPVKNLKVLKRDIVKNGVLSDYLEIDSIVSLELVEGSLIGEIAKVIITDDRIYVLDYDIAKSLFCFDHKGKYINSFKNIGKGPQQYEILKYFDVYNENVYLTVFPYKLFQLDKDLNFVKIIPVKWPSRRLGEFIGERMEVINNDTILFLGFKNEYNLNYYDLKRKKFFSKLSKLKGTYSKLEINPVTLNGKSYISATKQFYDTVYLLTPQKMHPHLNIEFEDPLSSEIKNQLEITDPFKRGAIDKMYDISNFYETDEYVYFRFIYQQRFLFLFHNKNTLKTNILPHNLRNDLFGSKFFPFTKGTHCNSIIAPVEASVLIESEHKIKTDIPDGLTPNSNPVLVFFHPKFD